MSSEAPRVRLSRHELRSLGLWLFAGLIGLFIALRYHQAAFPSASIDFRITRAEAEQRAVDFLRVSGFDPARYRAVTVFDYDDAAKVYLEREVGLKRANRLMNDSLSVWRWDTRFFRPSEQEELVVSLGPGGDLIGFHHEIEETRAGASLSAEEAERIAGRFLIETRHFDPALYDRIEGESSRKEARVDHTFTWERRGFKAAEATARVAVTVRGDQIGGYREYLKIPETWQRDYARLRSRNELSQMIAQVGWIAVLMALMVVFVRESMRRGIAWQSWRFGLTCGVTLAIVSIALTLNNTPLYMAEYRTTDSLGSHYADIVLYGLVEAGVWMIYIGLAGAVGAVVYRKAAPEKLAPEWLFSWKALRSKEYFLGSVVGYLIPPIMLGYVTAFYLIGARFGVWSPSDIEYTDLASTAMPWLFPLSIGLQASIHEEFLFRLFAVSLLRRYLKSTFLAILIPAALWGFLHSAYPQQPFYIRGVELTAVGVLFGYVLVRYGILSTLIAHYGYNALLAGLFLFQSSRLYFQISGAVVVGLMLIPLIPAVMGLLRRRLEEDAGLSNASVEEQLAIGQEAAHPPGGAETLSDPFPAAVETPQPDVARTTPVYTPLSAKKHLVIWGLAALPGVTLFTLPFERLFDFVRMETDRASALQAAEQYLFQRGVDPSSYERVATLTTVEEGDGLPVRYLRQRLGVTGVNEAYRSRLIPAAWNTRFFKPLQKEEYRILVHMDGRVVRYDHRLDEAAPGDTLTPEAAREIAEREIAGAWDMTGYTLVETTAERRVGRIDHTFTWEDTLRRVGAGHFRIQAEVQGAETVRIRPHFKPPEAWVREEQRTTAADTARRAVTLFVGALIIGLAFRLYIPWILQRRVNWRFAVIAAAIYTGLSALTRILNLTDFYAAYDTSVSLSTYMATMSVVFLMGNLIFPMFTLLVLFSFVETGYRQAFPDKTDLTAWFRGMARSQHGETRSVWRDAMALSFAACLLGPGVRRVMQATSHYLGVPTQTSLEALSFASSVLPVASGLLEAITDAMLFGGLLLWGVIMARHYLPGTGALFGVMAVLAMAMTAGGADTWTEFGVKSGQLLFQFALLFMGVRYLWRDNLTACALTIFLLSLTGHAWDTLLYAPRTYGVSGIILLILALASPFILRRSVRSRKSASLPA